MPRLAVAALVLLLAACSAPGRVAAGHSPSPGATSIPATSAPGHSPDAPPPSVGIDWLGTVLVDAPAGAHGSRARQSPDGSRFLVGSTVVTADRAQVGELSPAAKVAWIWADDSRHLCAAYDPTFTPGPPSPMPTNLYVELPGQPPALISRAGSSGGQSGPTALGCSFTQGTATVGEVCVIRVCEAWTIDLQTHATRSHLVIPETAGMYAVTSADDNLLAVSGGASPTVWNTADGSRLASLAAGTRVVAFTGDDAAALVVSGASVRLIDWRTLKVLATLPGSDVEGALVEPGGKRLAVALGSPVADSSGYPPPGDVAVAGTDGRVTLLGQGLLAQF